MTSVADQLEELVAAALLSARTFCARVEAIDALEVHVVERVRLLEERGGANAALRQAKDRAEQLRARLEERNAEFLRRVRARIAQGRFTRSGLIEALRSRADFDRTDGGYDTLDLLVGALIGAGEPLSAEAAALEPEMVGYQPTPARTVLQFIERAAISPDDVVYDVGSGLGHVAILVALLTGARARGVERDPAYTQHAIESARRLNVACCDFECVDARNASFDDGTVFFLYTPFRRELLQLVLERLRTVASAHPIRICTLGPCTPEVAAAGWLQPVEAVRGEHEVTVFRSIRT